MRLGFICPALPGHLNPMTVQARQLQARNHDVASRGIPGFSLSHAMWIRAVAPEMPGVASTVCSER